jgi:hypothetical protein
MPGFYPEDEYDLAGFAVGIVDKRKCWTTRHGEGDAVIALPSSGIHSNGFSLVRKALDVENTTCMRPEDELGETLGDALLAPTKIYVKPCWPDGPGHGEGRVPHHRRRIFREHSPQPARRAVCGHRPARREDSADSGFKMLASIGRSGTCSTPSTWAWA